MLIIAGSVHPNPVQDWFANNWIRFTFSVASVHVNILGEKRWLGYRLGYKTLIKGITIVISSI